MVLSKRSVSYKLIAFSAVFHLSVLWGMDSVLTLVENGELAAPTPTEAHFKVDSLYNLALAVYLRHTDLLEIENAQIESLLDPQNVKVTMTREHLVELLDLLHNRLPDVVIKGTRRSTISAQSFSPNGQKIALYISTSIYIFDATTLFKAEWLKENHDAAFYSAIEPFKLVEYPKACYSDLSWSPDGKRIYALIQPDRAKDQHTLAQMEEEINKGIVCCWDTSTGTRLFKKKYDTSTILSTFDGEKWAASQGNLNDAFNRDADHLYGHCRDVAILCSDGKIEHFRDVAALSPDGKYVLHSLNNRYSQDYDGDSVSYAFQAVLIDLENLNNADPENSIPACLGLAVHRENKNNICITTKRISLLFSSNGLFGASAGLDAVVNIYDLTALPQRRIIPLHHNGVVTAMAFSPDSSMLVTAAREQYQDSKEKTNFEKTILHLWNLSNFSSQVIHTIGGCATSLGFNGKYVVIHYNHGLYILNLINKKLGTLSDAQRHPRFNVVIHPFLNYIIIEGLYLKILQLERVTEKLTLEQLAQLKKFLESPHDMRQAAIFRVIQRNPNLTLGLPELLL